MDVCTRLHTLLKMPSEKHPALYVKFCAAKFVIYKTSNSYSAMAINQCHEQNNTIVIDSA